MITEMGWCTQSLKLVSRWDKGGRQGDKGGGSTLTAMREEPGEGLLLVFGWLILDSDWQQGASGGGSRLKGWGFVIVVLPFRQQVTDLLLQFRIDGVLGQNQNPQTGWVVLHHV